MKKTLGILFLWAVLFGFCQPGQAYNPWGETNYHMCVEVNYWGVHYRYYVPLNPKLEDSRVDLQYLTPPGFNVGTTTYRQGKNEYTRALDASTAAKLELVDAMGEQRKKYNAPVTGRGVTSWGFQQWVSYGLESYEAFLRLKKIYDALRAGQLTINLYDLAPKIALQQVDDVSGLPTGSVTTLSLIPASKSEWSKVKNLTNFSSPEYRFSNKVNLSELENLKLNVNVKPGIFMRAFGDQSNTDGALWNQAKNSFEMMVALGQIKRGILGAATTNSQDVRLSRFTPETLKSKTEDLVQLHAQLQTDEANQIATVLQKLNPDAAKDFRNASAAVYSAERKAAINALRGLSERYSRSFYKARDVMNEMNNHVQMLESAEYIKFVGQTDATLEKYSTKDGTASLGENEALAGALGIDGVTTRYDKLINDELSAIRNIVAIRARRQLVKDYAPYLGKTETYINQAMERLNQVQARNTALDASITAREKLKR